MKKKILFAIMAMMLTTAFIATGCSSIDATPSESSGSEIEFEPKQVLTDKATPEETATTAEESAPEPVQTQTGTPFSKEDAYVADFTIGDNKADVLSIAGTPDTSYDVTMEATGEVRNINDYSFGSLVFVDDKLVVIQVVDATYEGPRGIKVGMNLDDAIALFASDLEHDTDYMSIFYRANPDGEEFTTVPPYGMLYKGDMQTLAFSVFAENSGADTMTLQELEADYMFMEQYNLTCEFDAQGVMHSFAVRVGATSE